MASSTAPAPNTQTPQVTKTRLAYIDGLRGVAIAAVLLLHARTWSGGFDLPLIRYLGFGLGRAGVDLFLCLSGFCLFLPLVRQGDGSVQAMDVGEYARRRARRILPPYYPALLLAIFSCWVCYRYGGPGWWSQPFQDLFPIRGVAGAGNLVTHFTLTHGLINRYTASIDGAYWSLSTEAQFYVLLPPLIWIARRYSIAWAVLVPIATSLVFRGALFLFRPVVLSYYIGDMICFSRWVEFGFGMLAAAVSVGAIFRKHGSAATELPRRLFPIMVLAVGFALFMEARFPGFFLMPFVWGSACCLLLICAGHPGRMRACLEWPPLVGLGTISYSVYLLHDTVFRLMATYLTRHSQPVEVRALLYFFLGIPVVLLISVPFFRLLELPFLTARRRLTGAAEAPSN